MQDTTQRTDEWFAKRVGRVTGSRAGAILGLSPWQTPDDVLRSMVREYHGAPSEFETNPAIEHGVANERRAMLAFMRESGLYVEDCDFFPYGDWSGASPDGITDDGGTVELKVPFSKRNGEPFKTLDEQPHYYAQVQLEILSAGKMHGYFAQYRAPKGDPFNDDYISEKILIERVTLDEDFLNAELPRLREFHNRYLNELDNPAHLAPLRISLDSDKALHIVNRIGELGDAIANFEQEKKDLLAKLVQMADEKDAIIHGHKLTKTKDSQSVAYSKAIKDLLPDADLSKYTTTKAGYWRLS